MKAFIYSMLLLSAVALAPASQASSRSASMQVSFTVVESCSVQANVRQQTVQCDLATPYAISKPANPAAAAQGGADTVADTKADTKVVTITF